VPTRILIVEDNDDNLALMRYLLTAHGYVPLAAGDGEAGLEVAAREAPDLIVCDIQLPRLSGLDVARRLKAQPALGRIPLLAVTAFAMVGDREKVLAAGFDGYLAKPIDPERFVAQIEAFLRPDQRSAARPPVPATPAASVPRPARGALLLVVDNRPANLDLALSLFEPLGFRVVTAAGIAEALKQARQTHPHLILSDVHMDEETGYDLLQAVRADPELRAIPFVFLTATARDEAARVKALALGATRYLIRPIDLDVLVAELEACLQESQDQRR
jgi:two-component system, cell cycle response regulator